MWEVDVTICEQREVEVVVADKKKLMESREQVEVGFAAGVAPRWSQAQ